MSDFTLLTCCSKMTTPTAMPASNASTGSSRPPEPPKPPPADLYDPFAAESYDYDPSPSDRVPEASPHVLPPLPTMTPRNSKQAGALPAAALVTVNTPTDRQASGVANSAWGNGTAGSSMPPVLFPAIPPPLLSGQPASASRKRKSRWEDAGPDGANHAADPASAALPDAAMHAVPAEAPRPRRSRFSDAPPPAAHVASPQPGQGPPAPHPPLALATSPSMPSVPPKPSQPAAKPEALLPPKPASARQDGEAQAAAALQAVEQMLQAKRHSDARNIAPSTSRPKQAPLPAHQPALPRPPPPPPPQPPLPQMPPPQPAFTEAIEPGTSHAAAGPSWHAQHAGHAAHALPAHNPRPLPPFPGQQPGFPHIPTMLQQQGLPPHMPLPHMGHFAPQQFVQAGLQQHHRPAPLHHLPSMLQNQNQLRPPPHGRPQPQAPAPQQYRPPPPISQPPPQHQHPPPPQPRPQRQGSSGIDRQPSAGMVDQQPGRPVASPGVRQLPSEADLGHFQTTSVAMDTPTDTGPGFAWKRGPPEGPPRTPGPPPALAGASSEHLHITQDINQIQIPVESAEDGAVPGPPPSPPTAPPPPPPPLFTPGASPPTAPPSASAPAGIDNPTLASSSQAQSSTLLASDPAAAAIPEALAGESKSHPPALTSASGAAAAATSSEVDAAVNHLSDAPSADAAHGAAPAGPAEDTDDQQKGI